MLWLPFANHIDDVKAALGNWVKGVSQVRETLNETSTTEASVTPHVAFLTAGNTTVAPTNASLIDDSVVVDVSWLVPVRPIWWIVLIVLCGIGLGICHVLQPSLDVGASPQPSRRTANQDPERTAGA